MVTAAHIHPQGYWLIPLVRCGMQRKSEFMAAGSKNDAMMHLVLEHKYMLVKGDLTLGDDHTVQYPDGVL